MKTIPFHKHANLFPLLQSDEFEELVEDIKSEGLHDAITLFEKQILDGRNRYRACIDAKVTPRFVEYKGSRPLEFVISRNLKRRHLNESQRAWIAEEIATLRKGGRSIVDDEDALTQREAATKMRVGVRSVQRVSKIKDKVSKEASKALDTAIRDGKLNLTTAETLVNLEQPKQARILKRILEIDDPDEASGILAKESRNIREEEIRASAKKWNKSSDYKGPYPLVYADPPWAHGGLTRSPGAEQHYPTMETDDICTLEVQGRGVNQITLDDAALYLWVPTTGLADGLTVMEAWGFEFVSQAAWGKVKDGVVTKDMVGSSLLELVKNNIQIGMGAWFRNAHEVLLVGRHSIFHPRRKGAPVRLFSKATRLCVTARCTDARAHYREHRCLNSNTYFNRWAFSGRKGVQNWRQ